ncbi:hypothetical protein FRC06_002973, partial [Ceratobasidium sp. 370]
PQVIENIPNRFHALEGKTIALDGTLVTQRLHFAPDPRPYRHVLGWYQLITELRQHNIKVVCVFDGKHRIPAKLHELERRRQTRLEAQARAAWEKSRHERLLSLTEVLQNLESLPGEHQKEVLDSLRDQVEQTQPPGLPDTMLVLDPPAADTQQGDLAAPAQPTSGHFPESILPVEEPTIPQPDSEPSAAISTSSTEEISASQGLSDAESSYVVSPNPAVDERSIVQDLPPSDDDTKKNAPEQDRPLPECVAPNPNDQAIPPDETLPTEDEPLESHAAPKASTPTTPRDASSSPAQPSDLPLSKDSAVSEPEHGGDETTMGRHTGPVNQGVDFISPSTPSLEQAKSELDLPAGVNDSQYLSKVIRHLHEHYTRTSTIGGNGLIPAWSEGPDPVNLPDIPISRVQLKYTQEESKLWGQLVPTSSDTNVDITRVVEQVKELASVQLPPDEPEPEPAEQEVEQAADQAAEQEGDEAAPISEWAATLEEQSSLMVASLMRRASPPTTLTYTESRLILEAMGVPCLESPMHYEAEALASSIVINGLADFVGSEDTDVLMYNAPLLRHMTNSKVPLQIIPPSTETGLGLSRSAFMDAAILMGTDFVRRLKKIGPATAYRLMEKHGSIERMLEEEPKFRPPDVAEYLEQVKVARLIFSSLPPAPPPESIAQGDWDEQAIQETMAHFGLQRYMGETLIPDALSDNYFIE